jgi:aspartyl-tRNA(Asn)/glutamyl-tRNA(Gln) amidotransferase subunit A
VLSWTLDKLGPLALTADDCGLVLEAIAGPDPGDPTTAPDPFRHDDAGPSARRFRFGVVTQALAACDDGVRANLLEAVDVLRRLGTVEDVTLPDLPYEATARIILGAEAASAFEDLVESGRLVELTAPEDRYTPYARDAILAKDYVRALRLRGLMAREAHRVLSTVDVLVAPSRPTVAPRLGQEFRRTANDVAGALGNLAGLPAISVPSGFDPSGLPTSVQLLGAAFAEDTVLGAARAYQAVTGWHRRHPTVA